MRYCTAERLSLEAGRHARCRRPLRIAGAIQPLRVLARSI
jgi:hypothetical protein